MNRSLLAAEFISLKLDFTRRINTLLEKLAQSEATPSSRYRPLEDTEKDAPIPFSVVDRDIDLDFL